MTLVARRDVALLPGALTVAGRAGAAEPGPSGAITA